MLLYYLVVVLSCLVLADAGKPFKGKPLVSYITPCSRSLPDFNKCAKENGLKAIPSILKGDKAYKIPVLAPLQLDRLEIKPDENFELILTKATLYGLDETQLKKTNIQLDKKYLEAELGGDGLRIMSDYKISGQILVLPISGEGKCDFKFDDYSIIYSAEYDLVKKSDGKEYGMIKNPKVIFKANKAKFYLDNLFNGNKQLGDNMNKVLNENYVEVLKDLGGAISAVIEAIATGIIGGVLGVVPFDEEGHGVTLAKIKGS